MRLIRRLTRMVLFTLDFRFMLPVTCIDGLSHGMECHERVGLSQICDPSFDAPRETMVEPTVEGHIVITNVSCQPIDCNNVFDNTLVVLHDDVVKSVLGIPDWVESAEIRTEITFKFLKVSHPGGCRVLVENAGLKPFQSGAPEVQESEVDVLHVRSKHTRARLKIEFQED